MIKFLGGGGKKTPEKSKVGGGGKGFVPVDKAKDMSNKGFTEPEIIDALRKEGFSSMEIDSALTQTLKLGVTGDKVETSSRIPTLQELKSQENTFAQPQGVQPPMDQNQMQQPPVQQDLQGGAPAYNEYYQDDYSTEEMVESIVHEKMVDLDKKLIDFKSKYTEMERKMTDLHHQLTLMGKTRSENQEKIINKLDSFKDEINDINARISSLEKAFKEALPALIESVRSLTDLVQRIKREAV